MPTVYWVNPTQANGGYTDSDVQLGKSGGILLQFYTDLPQVHQIKFEWRYVNSSNWNLIMDWVTVPFCYGINQSAIIQKYWNNPEPSVSNPYIQIQVTIYHVAINSYSTRYTYLKYSSSATTTSDPGNINTINPPPIIITTPTASLGSYSYNNVNLSWAASLASYGLKQYDIYRNSNFLTTVNNSTTSYNDTTVIPGTNYNYNIKAIDNNLNSVSSNIINVTTPVNIQSSNGVIKYYDGSQFKQGVMRTWNGSEWVAYQPKYVSEIN